ncbi:hydrogenase maturation protease [Methylosinus sp. Sm6]|uniref:hydrogenase maturation protease n=1 Tax=Methylosinus sp. Sm6 TaxID=2866948 RepID=UPI001C994756|nr:hydrogenase maturation protease [Methylosinus sp. Sm6]MBY6241412.1 hydrogenase maturation protease [Methylosinus sp. Sm6]
MTLLTSGSPVRHIVCFGNPLHGDDGFGPAVYQRLASLPLPRGLRLFDCGTAGLAALAAFEACDEAVIVDAAAPAGAPGRLGYLSPESISLESAVAGHGSGLGYLLRVLAAQPEPAPKIIVLAAEASSLAPFQPGLSRPVARAVENAVAELSAYIGAHRHG